MISSTDLTTLNHRLVALNLPALTAASLAELPTLMNMTRIEHALRKAEGGEKGAWQFLTKHLPASAPATPASARQIAANPGAPPNTDTAPAPAPAAPPPPRPPATPAAVAKPPSPSPSRSERVQCRIYGGKAALCIESDATRQNEPTLRIEAAPATGPRAYDWKQKLMLQLTCEELPVIAATVLGLLPRCEYKNHGPNQDKGLEIVHQGTHLFVRLFQKERGVLAVPVTAADSYALGALCLRQLRKTAPWLSDQGVLALLRLTIQRMETGAAAVADPAADGRRVQPLR